MNRTLTSESLNPVRSPPKQSRSLTNAVTEKLPIPPTHTTLAHCATCRGCLHLRVGQHNSPNRNDTKNGHTTRCTHEKLSKMSKNSGTVHCRGHRAMLIYTRKYFSVTISIDCVLYSPLGLAQTAVKSGTTPHFRSPGTAKDGGARWGRARGVGGTPNGVHVE